jgi:hypothetical protein
MEHSWLGERKLRHRAQARMSESGTIRKKLTASVRSVFVRSADSAPEAGYFADVPFGTVGRILPAQRFFSNRSTSRSARASLAGAPNSARVERSQQQHSLPRRPADAERRPHAAEVVNATFLNVSSLNRTTRPTSAQLQLPHRGRLRANLNSLRSRFWNEAARGIQTVRELLA